MRVVIIRVKINWEEIFKEFEDSKLSQKEFCDSKGINLGTFRKERGRNKTKLQNNIKSKSTNAEIEWKLATYQEKSLSPVIIEIGKINIRVSSDVDVITLEKVLKVLTKL